jgi:erythromycin esterase-like protein
MTTHFPREKNVASGHRSTVCSHNVHALHAEPQVQEFVEWMREYNANRDVRQRAGFYGMDLYSFIASSNEVLEYLEKVGAATLSTTRVLCVSCRVALTARRVWLG